MKKITNLALAALTVAALPSGANAAVLYYQTVLDGLSEAPPNASPGSGVAWAAYDNVANTLTLHVSFSGLIGTTTNSHIHGPTAAAGTGTAGVATTTPTFAGFPVGVTSGTYSKVLDLTLASSYNPTFVTNNGGTTAGAQAALTAAIAGGKAYLNIHSSVFPGGEIRGFFAPVPEPASWAMMIAGFAIVGGALRRRSVALA